jgi:fatty acid desaturase
MLELPELPCVLSGVAVGALVGVSVGAVVVFGVAVMIQAALVGVMVGEAGALNSRLAEKLHAISANTLHKITIMNRFIGQTPCALIRFFPDPYDTSYARRGSRFAVP